MTITKVFISYSSIGNKMENPAIRTVADELFDLVKNSKKISIENAAKQLRLSVATVQGLVDFLVEEKIFGIEYKFTTPYVYLYKEGLKAAKSKGKSFTKGLMTKEDFYLNSKEHDIPYEQIEGLWRSYLQKNLIHIREEFIKKAQMRNIPTHKIEDLWKKYLTYL